MTPVLHAALLECRARRGTIEGALDAKAPDVRLLRLCTRTGRPYAKFRLAWPEYFAAYCLWQELSRPGIGRMGQRKQKAA